VPLDFLKKSVESASSRLQKCMQNDGAYVEVWHYMVVYGLQNDARIIVI
jgi:hypothetical protein